MAWGSRFAGAQPGPPIDQDPFTDAERDTRAMVSAGWWPGAPPQQRQHAVSGRVLVLPDGTWWLFGAWARWYRWHPSEGQWHLCPPPHVPATRLAARPVPAGTQIPPLPPHVVPAGPDFNTGTGTGTGTDADGDGEAGADSGTTAQVALPFVGHPIPAALTARVRATLEAAAALPAADYPHRWALFSPGAPSTAAATWGVMLWCAAAPVFDSRMDDRLLGLWAPYLAKPLSRADGPRWLTPPPLEALAGLYAERLRAGQTDAALVLLRTMWSMASALRDEPRFRVRAKALLAILGTTLNNPAADTHVLGYGDQAVVQQWLTRCPSELAPALRHESSPGDHFRHAFYELAELIAEISGDPADPAYLEPRFVAAALTGADLAVTRSEVAAKVVPWLDPEIRFTVQALLAQTGHPLRRLWPVDAVLPAALRDRLTDGERRAALLGAMYGVDLAWCRLGRIPARPRGFPVPLALAAEIMGVDRVRASAAGSPGSPGSPDEASAAARAVAPEAKRPQPPVGPAGWPGGQEQGPPPGSAYGHAAAGEPGQDGRPEAGPPRPVLPQPYVREQPAGPPPGTPPPGLPLPQGSSGPAAGGRPGPSGPDPVRPFMQQPAMAPRPEAADETPGGVPGAGADADFEAGIDAGAEPSADEPPIDWAPPYTALGFARPGSRPPAPERPAAHSAPAPGTPVRPAGEPLPHRAPAQEAAPEKAAEAAPFDPAATCLDVPQGPATPPRTKVMQEPGASGASGAKPPKPPAPALAPAQAEGAPGSGADRPGRPPVKPDPGTRVMSETLVAELQQHAVVPQERQAAELPAPPPGDRARQVTERFGIAYVSGIPGAGEEVPDVDAFLETLRRSVTGGGTGTSATESTSAAASTPPPPATVLDASAGTAASTPSPPATILDANTVLGAENAENAENAEAGSRQGDLDATRVDGAAPRLGVANILLVGSPHTGQRRMSRIIALTLAEAGLGDGSIRMSDAGELQGASPLDVTVRLRAAWPVLLLEGLDRAVAEAGDQIAFAAAVRTARAGKGATGTLIATCEPRAYQRLRRDHPNLLEPFTVFRLPDLTDTENRLTLLHVLADERRATVGDQALEVVRDDLDRLRGPGDLVNARLVEAYLDEACQRHLGRAGVSGDRLVLTPEDFKGIAESIEPALRPPGEVGGFLRRLDGLVGLTEVKRTVRDLIAGARSAAERARHGVQEGNPSRNLIFFGPPGVGKTTVAGLLGGAYAALGLLDSGHQVACRPVHLEGRDASDTARRVASMVDQAIGGVLVIQQAHRLDRSRVVIEELHHQMVDRGDRFMVICCGPPAEMDNFLHANPGFRAEFGEIVQFEGLGDRDLVALFQQQAERDLYLVDEELRVELLQRLGRMREGEGFAFARTVREIFEQTIARQAARLAGMHADAATSARLRVDDLPESSLERMLGHFQRDRDG